MAVVVETAAAAAFLIGAAFVAVEGAVLAGDEFATVFFVDCVGADGTVGVGGAFGGYVYWTWSVGVIDRAASVDLLLLYCCSWW